jgi:hypothetical protein
MKKIGLSLILCVVMSMPIFASVTERVETLTVDQAVEAAIRANNDLKNMEDTMATNSENLDKLKENFRDEWDYGTILSMAVQIMELETRNNQVNNNSNLSKEKLRISVMNLFSSIIGAQNALQLTDESLAIEKRKLDIAKVRHDLGFISKLEYDTQANTLRQRRTSRNTHSIAIDNAYVSLNKLLGYSLTRKHVLVLDVTYEPLGDINLTAAINNAVARDPNLINQQGNVDVAEYKREMFDSETSKDTEEVLDRGISQAERTVYDTRRGIEQKIINAYNSINENEIKHNNAVLELEALNMQLPVRTKMLELGRITRLELDQLHFQITQQKETIRSLESSLAIDIIQFRNPWTL